MITAKPLHSSDLQRRFGRDVVWVLASLVIAGLGGVAVNAYVAARMGSATLGVFSQAFALYIVLSQIAVGGLQFSVLRHISAAPDDTENASIIASSAMVLVGLVSAVVCGLTWLLKDTIGQILGSSDVAVAIGLMLPGLFAYSLNKLLLYVLNGLRHMRAYAVFQSLRFALLFPAIAVMVAMGQPGRRLTLSISVAEIILFLGLVGYVRLRLFRFRFGAVLRPWYSVHVAFGLRGFLSGVLHEINTRVDILLLGYFRDDATVGIYSFAAILAEGFAQIPLAVRTNVDPIIGRHLSQRQFAEIEAFSTRLRRVFFPLMLVLGALAVVLYPMLLRLIRVEPTFATSWPVFAILMTGISLNARYRPFMGILLQAGRPGSHTWLVGAVVLCNFILNLALIPILGALGSAMATATAFLVEAFLIALLGRKLVGVRL